MNMPIEKAKMAIAKIALIIATTGWWKMLLIG
jgi:uncharacterized membrane protein